jgi:hypothetical protein
MIFRDPDVFKTVEGFAINHSWNDGVYIRRETSNLIRLNTYYEYFKIDTRIDTGTHSGL